MEKIQSLTHHTESKEINGLKFCVCRPCGLCHKQISMMDENEIIYEIREASFVVFRGLGPFSKVFIARQTNNCEIVAEHTYSRKLTIPSITFLLRMIVL